LPPLALRFLLAVFVALAFPAFAAAKGDASRPRVLLVVDEPASPLIRRLSAELAELDVTVVTRSSVAQLDAAAREEGAVAAIRVVPARNGVEVWMADANSGRSLVRQVIVDEGPAGPNYNNIALQAAELLRTNLLYGEKNDPAESAPPKSAPAAAVPAARSEAEKAPDAPPKEERHGDAGVQAGLGALYSPGGVSTAFQAWIAAHYPLEPWLAAGVELSMPLQQGSVSGPEGTSTVGVYFAAATLSLRWRRPEGRWFAGAGLGGGMARVTTEAKPVAPLAARDATGLTGLAYLRADAGFGVAPWLRIGARALVGLSIPPVRVEFAGNDAGTWGAPLLGGLGFIEIPWG
jgi:hypothetical protein